MSTQDRSRQPKGVPTGGQYASEARSEVDVDLDDHAWVEDPDYPMADWQMEVALGDTRRGYEDWVAALREQDAWDEARVERSLQLDTPPDTLEERLALEADHAVTHGYDLLDEDTPYNWTSLRDGLGDRYAEDLYDRCDGSLGQAAAISNQELADAGITTRAQAKAFSSGDLKPSDLHSEDRDLRMHAHAARGDMIFEGELLSQAYDLDRHSAHPGRLKGRTLGRPSDVHFREGTEVHSRRWHELSAEEQLSYIDGYTSVFDSQVSHMGDRFEFTHREPFRDRSPLRPELHSASLEVSGQDEARLMAIRREGQQRARQAGQFAHEMKSGTRPENLGAWVSMPLAQQGDLSVSRVERLGPGTFRGYPEPGQLVYRADGTTFELSSEQPVHFTMDEYLGDTAF